MGSTKSLGKSLFGTCSIRAGSKTPLAGPIVLFVYCLFAIGTLIYYKKRVPKEKSKF